MSKEMKEKLTAFEQEGIIVIELSGDIQQENADELEEMLYQYFNDGYKNIIINTENARNICSSALGLLLSFKKFLNEATGEMKVVITSGKIMELFKVTMMDKVFDILDNLPEALSSF